MTADMKSWIRQARSLVEARRAHGDHPHRVGVRRAERGDLSGAVESFREALALDPDAPWTNQALGDALYHLGNFAEADAAYRRALAAVPAAAIHQREQLAIGMLRTGSTIDGIAELRSVLSVAPGRPPATTALAAALLSGPDEERADGAALVATLPIDAEVDPGVVAAALVVLPRSPALHRRLARVAAAHGEHRRAVAHLTVAVAHDPTDRAILVDLADSIVLGRTGAAVDEDAARHVLELLRGAMADAPDELGVARASAALCDLVAPLEAPAVWRNVIRLAPTEPRWVRCLGDALAALGDVESAGAAYCEAVRLGHDVY